MTSKSILLVGCPDSGKSNYVARLWGSLKNNKGGLERIGIPDNIAYVESLCEHLLQGEFCARTDTSQERQDFRVALRPRGQPQQDPTELVVPDFTGELWLSAVVDSEMSPEWLKAIQDAEGALLFVRVHSELNVQPWDWVTARNALQTRLGGANRDDALPTQVILCELLRLLETHLGKEAGLGRKPRIAVIVTAWDRLDEQQRQGGPIEFLRREFPLFFGAFENVEDLELNAYGISIVGGDLARDLHFQQRFLGTMRLAEAGSVTVLKDGRWVEDPDITIPVGWAIGA